MPSTQCGHLLPWSFRLPGYSSGIVFFKNKPKNPYKYNEFHLTSAFYPFLSFLTDNYFYKFAAYFSKATLVVNNKHQ